MSVVQLSKDEMLYRFTFSAAKFRPEVFLADVRETGIMELPGIVKRSQLKGSLRG